jgi:hypothetical protein
MILRNEATMNKGIKLTLKLWIEGEDEPAHDFAKYSMHAIQEMLASGKTLYPHLQVKILSTEEDTDWDDDEKEAR